MLKKFLIFVFGGGLLLFICFVLLLWTTLSVGHLNFLATKSELNQIATLAEKLELKPGQSTMVVLNNGALVPAEFMGTHVWRDAENRLFISINRGGGHLGRQGYIYSSDPDIKPVEEHGFPLAESHEFKRMNSHWWSYDSTEE